MKSKDKRTSQQDKILSEIELSFLVNIRIAAKRL
jgi:hypothetical protein